MFGVMMMVYARCMCDDDDDDVARDNDGVRCDGLLGGLVRDVRYVCLMVRWVVVSMVLCNGCRYVRCLMIWCRVAGGYGRVVATMTNGELR